MTVLTEAVAVALAVAVVAVIGAAPTNIPTEGWGFLADPNGMPMTDDRTDDDLDDLARWIDDGTEAALREAGFLRRQQRS